MSGASRLSDIQKRRLHGRLVELVSWLEGALEVYEGRTPIQVEQATQAFLKWRLHVWSESTTPSAAEISEALTFALDEYMECGPGWADVPASFGNEIVLDHAPEWLFTEFYLVVSLTLARRALLLFTADKDLSSAAMLYTDSVEARAVWNSCRGLSQSRNPNATFVKVEKALRDREDEFAIRAAASREGRRKAEMRLAKDPKQVAKKRAMQHWNDWQAGKVLHKSGAAFVRFILDKERDIKNGKTVERWVSEWRELPTKSD